MTAKALKEEFITPKASLTYAEISNAVNYDEPGQAPLLYFLLKDFSTRFGAENLRMLSFTFGLLTILSAAWLGFELSGTALGGLIAGALVSLSPFLLYQSQTLTPATVLPALITVSCASFMRAVRSRSIVFWIVYTIAAGLSVLTSTLVLCVLLAQMIFLLSESKMRFRRGYLLVPKNTGYGFLAFSIIALAYLPVVAKQISHHNYSMLLLPYIGEKVTIDVLINSWIVNPLSVFLMNPHNTPVENCTEIALLLVAISSFAITKTFGDKKVVKLLLLVFLVTAIYFWLPDVIFGGQRTLLTKYWVQIPICVLMVGTCAMGLSYSTDKLGLRLLGPICMLFIVACQLYSAREIMTQKEHETVEGRSLLEVANVLKGSEPAIIAFKENNYSTDLCQMLALSKSVPPETKFLCMANASALGERVAKESENIYVFNPDDEVFKNIQNRGFRLTPVNKSQYFFKVAQD